MIFDFILGGLMTTAKPAQKNLIGKEREIRCRAWLPVKTTSGWVWLMKYTHIDVYDYVGRGPFGCRMFGWSFVENRK